MTAIHKAGAPIEETPAVDFDAIVIGAGMSGMYQLLRLRELGLRVDLVADENTVEGLADCLVRHFSHEEN